LIRELPAGRAEVARILLAADCPRADGGKHLKIKCAVRAHSFQRRDIMSRDTALSLTAIALLSLVLSLPTGDALAQQKEHISFKIPAENSKYTRQVNIEVGDTPNHIVRIFEIHRTFPDNAPVINGLKLAEGWDRGTADYVDGNGTNVLYSVFVLENGDTFFTRGAVVVQNNSDKLTATAVQYITGGTGKLARIQGITRAVANFDPKAGYNEAEIAIDYSVGK
jgi:hypothetical protein